MRLINRIANYFSNQPWRQSILLFVLAVSLFGFLHSDPTFADPDSFYHAKMAVLLSQRGAVTEFPWLSATNLKYSFTDHHFLYHFILVPLVLLFPPLIGLKIFTVIAATLAILGFFWLLRYLKIQGAFWYAVFLLTINPFIFRLALAKAQPLVFIFLFLFLYLLFSRRYLWLIFVSCLYVWLYAGWTLLLLLVGLYWFLAMIWLVKEKNWSVVVNKRTKALWQVFGLVFCVGLGLAAGIFFSPYFPRNLFFYWDQSFKIAVVNYQYIIGVGAEWYPYGLGELFFSAVPFFIIYLVGLVVWVATYRQQSMNSWYFFLLSFGFFGLTLKSRRYVEYFIPFALSFSVISINVVMPELKRRLGKQLPRKLILVLPLLLILAISPVIFRDLKSVKDSYARGFKFDKFAAPSRWLVENSLAGDIVFHSDWDEFPLLFYNNDHNFYLVGLDPTFMYEYDHELYRQWVGITTGQVSTNLYQTIKELFGAKYVLVDINQNKKFDQNLKADGGFNEVFSSPEAKIYRLAD
ncbi:MAG: hypothetical protein PHW95_01865 [Patescibacteria group bacterium]|nr:hypothetical protein [Patescibacteria group bacterium]